MNISTVTRMILTGCCLTAGAAAQTGGRSEIVTSARPTPAEKEQAAMAQERVMMAERAARMKAEAQGPLPSPAPYVVPAPAAPVMPPALATGKAGDRLELQVFNISDNRSTSGGGGLSLNLGLVGADLVPGSLIRQTSVTKAVDDSGRDLLVGARPPSPLAQTLSLGSNNSRLVSALRGGASPLITTSLTLGPTTRTAKSVARIEGTLELFAPSEANGSVVYVKGAQAYEGKQVPVEALVKNGVEFVLLTPEMIPEYRARAGLTGGPTPTATTVATFVLDPQNVLMGYVIMDAGGTPLQPGPTSSSPRGLIGFQNLPPSAANGSREYQIAFYLAGTAGVVTIPFSIENIPLP